MGGLLNTYEKCSSIVESRLQLIKSTDIYNERTKLTGKIRCYCGNVYARTMQYCTSCGLVAQKNTITCSCGIEIAKNVKFCSNCGASVVSTSSLSEDADTQSFSLPLTSSLVSETPNLHSTLPTQMSAPTSAVPPASTIATDTIKCVCGADVDSSEKYCMECGRKVTI